MCRMQGLQLVGSLDQRSGITDLDACGVFATSEVEGGASVETELEEVQKARLSIAFRRSPEVVTDLGERAACR